MIASPKTPLSAEDYLALETTSAQKHEFIDGRVFAMAGATDSHITIALNVAMLLQSHLRGTECRTYISDMKLRIDRQNCFYYPDVFVTCDARDRETNTFKRHPAAIVEVLSKSTEAFDRGDKFADYRTLETLREYILINHRHRRVECFRRSESNRWVLHTYTSETPRIDLAIANITLNLADVYEDVELEDRAEEV